MLHNRPSLRYNHYFQWRSRLANVVVQQSAYKYLYVILSYRLPELGYKTINCSNWLSQLTRVFVCLVSLIGFSGDSGPNFPQDQYSVQNIQNTRYDWSTVSLVFRTTNCLWGFVCVPLSLKALSAIGTLISSFVCANCQTVHPTLRLSDSEAQYSHRTYYIYILI